MPVVVGRLDERLDQEPRGVVDPDVDAAPFGLDARRERFDGARVAGVARDEDPSTGAPPSSEIPATRAPAAANRFATASPIPLEAPVTTRGGRR